MRKSALLIALFMSATFMTGFNMNAKINKLEEDEYTHFMALRVYMDPPNAKGERKKDERKEYLKLKTRVERDQWLKDKGLWDKFYQYPPHIREKIADGTFGELLEWARQRDERGRGPSWWRVDEEQ